MRCEILSLMARSALASAIKEAVKLRFAPLLRDEGFRKQGTDFYLRAGECTGLVNVQSSMRNTCSLSRFTLNLGRYFPAIDAAMAQEWTPPRAERWSIKIYNCQLRRQIGEFFPPYRDFWWEVTPESDVDDLAAQLADVWQQYGAPWMKRTLDLREAVSDLEAQGMYWDAAAGRLVLGEPEEASRLARAFVQSVTTTEHTHPVATAIDEKYLKQIQGWCARHELEM